MNNYTYLAKICSTDNHTDNIIIYASSYPDATNKILEYYTDEDILSLSIEYLSDMPFYIPSSELTTIHQWQDEAYV